MKCYMISNLEIPGTFVLIGIVMHTFNYLIKAFLIQSQADLWV